MSDKIMSLLIIMMAASAILTVMSLFSEHNLAAISMALNLVALFIYTTYKIITSIKTPPEEKLAPRINGKVRMSGDAIMVTPILLSSGEASCYLNDNGRWVRHEGILLDQHDYQRIDPNGSNWETVAPVLVSELSELLRHARIGDDIEALVTATLIAKKNGYSEEHTCLVLLLHDYVFGEQR